MEISDLTPEELQNKPNAELIKLNHHLSDKHEQNRNWLEKNAIPILEEQERLESLNHQIITILAKRSNILE